MRGAWEGKGNCAGGMGRERVTVLGAWGGNGTSAGAKGRARGTFAGAWGGTGLLRWPAVGPCTPVGVPSYVAAFTARPPVSLY